MHFTERALFVLVTVALLGASVCPSPASAEIISFEIDDPPSGIITAGSTFSVLVRLSDNTTNLIGYTLDVDVDGVPAEHVGTVTADAGLTNFYPIQNLLEQDPDDSIAPFPFSFIDAALDCGVLINAFSDSFGTVDLAIDGVSDILAQVFFDVSDDALGRFTISLGPDTSLGDENLDGVEFTSIPLEIVAEPVPAPGAALLAMIGMSMLGRVRRNTAR